MAESMLRQPGDGYRALRRKSEAMQLHGLDLELTGWFQVAWSGDIGPEEVVPLRSFGRDLVAYRGKDGVVRVHDRHCRHLGASLAHGGCVGDDGIHSPFP